MLIITLCILYIFRAPFSRGVHSHPRVNVHCVFAAASLPSIFHITLLFPCVCSSWCKDADRAGGAAAVQVFEGMPFQFHVGSWTSCFSEWHFRPRVYPCVLWGVCARAWSSCHGVLITTSHTCFPPRRSTPPPTHPPNFSCLMSHHQRQIQPQLLIPFSLHGFFALCWAGLARVQQPATLPLYQSAIPKWENLAGNMRFPKERQLRSSEKTPECQNGLIVISP